MRPRPEGRGELSRDDEFRPMEVCFNAATTRRPWRTTPEVRQTMPHGLLQCGHDPKAVENHGHRRHGGLRCNASMRPRPEGRGERDFAILNGTWPVVLQCGHDPKAVENEIRLCHIYQSLGCFNAATTRRPWRTLACRLRAGSLSASMRPRPEGRGELPARTGEIKAAIKSFNAATTRRPWRTTWRTSPRRRTPSLQCGHDPKAVENLCGSSGTPCSPRRFNAATTRRPWRTGQVARDEPGRHAASMRPRPEGRGEPEGFVVYALTQWAASMRPRPEGRGERR